MDQVNHDETAASVQETVRDELRRKYPKLARLAAGNGRMAAIRLRCMERTSGSRRDALECETEDCFLWRHWPARVEKRSSSADFAAQKRRKGTKTSCATKKRAAADSGPENRHCGASKVPGHD